MTALHPLLKAEIRDEMSLLTDEARGATAFARDWRNRHIAHKNLELALGDSNAEPLIPASSAAVEGALSALDNVLNAIDRSYNDNTTMFAGMESHGGAKRLILLLQKGLNAEATEEAKWEREWSIL